MLPKLKDVVPKTAASRLMAHSWWRCDMVRNRGALSAGATQQLRPFAGISWRRVFQLTLQCRIRSVVSELTSTMADGRSNTPRKYLIRTRNSARKAVLDYPVAALQVQPQAEEAFSHTPPVQIGVNQFVKPSPQCHAGAKIDIHSPLSGYKATASYLRSTYTHVLIFAVEYLTCHRINPL